MLLAHGGKRGDYAVSDLASCCFLLGTSCVLLSASYLLFSVFCFLFSVFYLLFAVCCLLFAVCWLLVAGCWLLVAGCWLLVAGCWLLVAGCSLSPSYSRLLITHHPLLTIHYSRLSTHHSYPLLSSDYLLQTTYLRTSLAHQLLHTVIYSLLGKVTDQLRRRWVWNFYHSCTRQLQDHCGASTIYATSFVLKRTTIKRDRIHLVGPRLVGPRLMIPRLVGPRLVGPRLVGPRLMGPRLVGPRLLVISVGYLPCWHPLRQGSGLMRWTTLGWRRARSCVAGISSRLMSRQQMSSSAAASRGPPPSCSGSRPSSRQSFQLGRASSLWGSACQRWSIWGRWLARSSLRWCGRSGPSALGGRRRSCCTGCRPWVS